MIDKNFPSSGKKERGRGEGDTGQGARLSWEGGAQNQKKEVKKGRTHLFEIKCHSVVEKRCLEDRRQVIGGEKGRGPRRPEWGTGCSKGRSETTSI